jgi:WD40 repeat protein
VQLLPGPDTTVYALAFRPDGTCLAATGKDGTLWELDPFGETRAAQVPAPGVSLAYSARGELFAGHGNGFARLDPDRFLPGKPAQPTPSQVTGLAFVTESLLAIGTGDRVKPVGGMLMLWDLAAGKVKGMTTAEPTGVKAVAAVAGRVAWVNGGRLLTVWEITRPDPVKFPLKHMAPSVALAPDGSRAIVAQEWGVAVFDASTRRELWSRREHKGTVSTVAYGPDGRWLASAARDGLVVLYDTEGRRGREFAFPGGKCYALAFAPDGLRLAAAGDGATVAVWDLE